MLNKQKLTTLILALATYEKSLAAEDCVALLNENPDAIINQGMLQALKAELEMEIIISNEKGTKPETSQTIPDETSHKPNKLKMYKHADFEIYDATGEHQNRKVHISESDCDLHIKVDHYCINLQNYDGDFELTVEDSMQPGVEIHNLSLPVQTS